MLQSFEILEWFPFTTEKKRTTIVVRSNERIILLCKVGDVLFTLVQGADSALLPLIASHDPAQSLINQFLDDCSKRGLRT